MLNRYRDVFASFRKHNVRYVVIGGVAVILYGVPRATFDLDILIDASGENARNLLNALSEIGFATVALTTVEDILAHEITIFKDRVRIDVQTATPGLDFQEGWNRRVEMDYQGEKFYVASREDIISSKRAAGRPVDREDVRLLENPDGKTKSV